MVFPQKEERIYLLFVISLGREELNYFQIFMRAREHIECAKPGNYLIFKKVIHIQNVRN